MSTDSKLTALNKISVLAATVIVGALASTPAAAADPVGACCHGYWGNGIICEMLSDHVCGDYQGTWYGPNVSCNDPAVTCDQQTDESGACCVPDADLGYYCDILTGASCNSVGGYFYGPGTSCSDPFVECDPLTHDAACCFEDPSAGMICVEVEEYKCDDLGGTWYAGLSCSDPFIDCDPSSNDGACCYEVDPYGLVCVEMTQLECSDLGGYFYGVSSVCSDPFVECDPLPIEGACCYDDLDYGFVCVYMIEEYCVDLSGYWYGAGISCSDPMVECEPLSEDGACCIEEGPGSGYWYCIETTLADCHSQAGVWYGLGSQCTDPGVNCDPVDHCENVAGSDCAGRPQYDKQDYLGFGMGRVAVQTVSPGIPGDRMLTVFDLTGIGAQPYNTAFPIGRYNHPSWTASNLGSIMGLAIDEEGNIYVTASQTWNIDVMGPSGWGAVYRIDTHSAAISTFAVLPTANSSLGSITYDCEHNQFFVSSFEDGLIYRLDYATGAILDTFDHGTPWSGAPGPVVLGDRPFGLEVNGEHLYYSLWNEDMANASSDNNQIWSVKLDGGGAPVPGAEQLEITLTDHYVDGNYAFSSPVADIDFSDEGTMLLGERTQSGISNMSAHQARVLEYECTAGGWVLTPHTFNVGIPQSAAGGVDAKPSRVWASADAMHLGSGDNIYGFQGLPATGGSIMDSWIIDYNDNLTIQDKTLLGDLVVTRVADEPAPAADCPVVQVLNVECGTVFAPFEFDFTFGVSNMDSMHTVTSVSMTPPSGDTMTPDHVTMALPPMHSWAFDSVLTGAAQGSTVCIDFEVTFSNGAVCTETICIDLPMCIIWEPGDFDFNELVNIDDLMMLIGAWGDRCDGLDNNCMTMDADGSGVIDMGDLLVVLGNWTP